MRFVSKINGKVAYNAGPDGKAAGLPRVEVAPGENVFTDELQLRTLAADDHFERHARAGDIIVLDENGQPVPVPTVEAWAEGRKRALAGEPAPKAPAPKPGKGGNKNAPAPLTDEQRATIDAYYAQPENERTAMRAAMSTEELALVDANPPPTPK